MTSPCPRPLRGLDRASLILLALERNQACASADVFLDLANAMGTSTLAVSDSLFELTAPDCIDIALRMGPPSARAYAALSRLLSNRQENPTQTLPDGRTLNAKDALLLAVTLDPLRIVDVLRLCTLLRPDESIRLPDGRIVTHFGVRDTLD